MAFSKCNLTFPITTELVAHVMQILQLKCVLIIYSNKAICNNTLITYNRMIHSDCCHQITGFACCLKSVMIYHVICTVLILLLRETTDQTGG